VAVTHTFAGLPVADYEAAYQWYVQLFGRPADMFPHGSEAVWRLTPTSAIYVVEDSERAGSGLLTVALDNLVEHERRLGELGIALHALTEADAPRRLVAVDPDGNRLTFFEDPAQSGE
jgi:catechol 2,3-dioxygenase-like lactoylglutathione lyase family enzyme